jgi:hypothetical protein
MGHPAVENRTPFAFEPLFLSDEEGQPLFVPLVKATYDLGQNGLTLAPEQVPPFLAGVPHGDPDTSSYRYEPEGSLPKPATDVVLAGSAFAPNASATEVLVALQVGPLRKGVRVLGDRVFFKSLGSVGMTKPVPFEKIPLQWERAFGGWDRSSPDERRHSFEPRNPVGLGFRASGTLFEEGVRCPNLEDPARPFKGWGDRPAPASFGFVSPGWEPRTKYAGTYDERWEKERAPLLPLDFDRRFLNAASPGLVASGYLGGGEKVVVAGVAPGGGAYRFELPHLPAPTIRAQLDRGPDAVIDTRLDTVIIDTDAQRLFLCWRGRAPLRDGPNDVIAIEVEGSASQ